MIELLSIDEFEKAADIMKNVAARTELVYSAFFSSQSGNDIYLKPENMQYTGSYMYIFGGVHIMVATIYSRSHKNVIEWE